MAGSILKTRKVVTAAALTLTQGQSLVSGTLTGGAAGTSLVIVGYDDAGVAFDKVTITALAGDTVPFDWAGWTLPFNTPIAAGTTYLIATVTGTGVATLYTL